MRRMMSLIYYYVCRIFCYLFNVHKCHHVNGHDHSLQHDKKQQKNQNRILQCRSLGKE